MGEAAGLSGPQMLLFLFPTHVNDIQVFTVRSVSLRVLRIIYYLFQKIHFTEQLELHFQYNYSTSLSYRNGSICQNDHIYSMKYPEGFYLRPNFSTLFLNLRIWVEISEVLNEQINVYRLCVDFPPESHYCEMFICCIVNVCILSLKSNTEL